MNTVERFETYEKQLEKSITKMQDAVQEVVQATSHMRDLMQDTLIRIKMSEAETIQLDNSGTTIPHKDIEKADVAMAADVGDPIKLDFYESEYEEKIDHDAGYEDGMTVDDKGNVEKDRAEEKESSIDEFKAGFVQPDRDRIPTLSR